MRKFGMLTSALVLIFVAALPCTLAHAKETTAAKPLTVDSTIGELLDNPASRAVLQSEVPVIASSPQIAAARDLPLRAIARYAPTVLTDARLQAIDARLAHTPGAVASGKPRSGATSTDPREALTLRTIPLWPDKAPGALGKRPEDMPTLTLIGTDGAASSGTAVIVAPGGGYQALASGHEGRQVADWFAAQGVTAFVLTYRLTPFGYQHPTQLIDAKRAIRWVRAHAGDYGINPHRIGMIGFSAGGNLTAMAETLFDTGDPKADDPVERASSRPDFAVLGYAAIDLGEKRWTELGMIGPKSPPDALREMSPALNVRPDTPPTFLFQTTTDDLVDPRNATKFYDALIAAKVPAEMHVFANGRHGLGLAMTDHALSVWPSLLRSWLEGIGMIGEMRALVGG